MQSPSPSSAVPTSSEVIRRLREDVARGEYHGAISTITQLLMPGEFTSSIASTPINGTQRLRLYLLRADCFSGLRSHQRALEDAKSAIEQSHALSPQAFFVAGRECYRLGRLKDSLDYFDSAETLMSTGVGVAEHAPTENGSCHTALAPGNENREDAWAMIGVCPREAPEGWPAGYSVAAAASPSSASISGGKKPPHASPAVASHGSSSSLSSLVGSSPKQLEPSYEWVQDLLVWRRYHHEVKILFQMTQTHVIPSRLSAQAIEFVSKANSDVSGGGSAGGAPSTRAQVVVIRNNTEASLRFAYQTMEGCEVVPPYSFADVIRPNEVAIGVVTNTTWLGGSTGTVVYTVEMGATVGFVFSAPMMSEYTAATWLRPGKSNSELQRSTDVASVKLRSRPSATSDVMLGHFRYKSIVAQVGRTTHFTVTQVRPVTLTITELVGALEFLPPNSLRKCSAVSWHVRECINHLPPPMFYTPTSMMTSMGSNSLSAAAAHAAGTGMNNNSNVDSNGSAAAANAATVLTSTSSTSDIPTCVWYPNYLFPQDFRSNPWIIRDPADVVWQIAFDALSPQLEDYVVVDAFDNRVLTVGLDMANKGFSSAVYYGGGRRRQVVSKISESWNPFSRSITWKLASGRRLGSVVVSANEVQLVVDGLAQPCMTMRRVDPSASRGGGNSSVAILHLYAAASPDGAAVAELRYSKKVLLSATKRGDVVAELKLKPGCDAFIASVLAIYGRTKWVV